MVVELVTVRLTEVELLKMKKDSQFPDETVRIKVSPIHYVSTQTN